MANPRSTQSKSMAFIKEKSNDYDKAIKALEQGAKVVNNCLGYGIEYPQGGYFNITISVYKKLVANYLIN